MDYRLYTPEDFDDLYAIERICFQPPFRFSRAYVRQIVELPGTATWIAVESGRMAGFAIVEWSAEPRGVVAYIQTIEVLPDERSRGVGAELLRRVEASAHAEGAHEIWLHVDARNAAAIRLYQASGYLNDGSEENYYAKGRAGDIYFKRLNSMQEN